MSTLKKLLENFLSKGTNYEEELTKVNREIYERNVELAVRNRTLSILSKIYVIINTSLGLEETAYKMIEAIVTELKFQKGFIALIDKKGKVLNTIAATPLTPEQQTKMTAYKHPFQHFRVPLANQDNFCVASVLHNQRRMANILYDIVVPLVTEKQAEEIAQFLNIKTSILYPIIFGGRPLGIMFLGMDKHVGDLSSVERETLKELIELVAIALERAQIYADLKVANEKLQELDKLKDEFVYVASHELRTPMTAIKSYLWLALNKHKENLDFKLRQDLERAYISTERLIKLVYDMLTISRIEGKRLIFNMEKFDLYELAKQITFELKVKAEEKKISLILVPSKEKLIVFADKIRAGEVLQNLVGNAIKFTLEKGAVTVSLRSKDGLIETAISDTGSGIAKDDLPQLFKKFGRLDQSYSKVAENSGTGLGLYISKQIVELHGGKIWVISEKGKGSTFFFTLPNKK